MVEHFNRIQVKLGEFPSHLLEEVIESEIYATENETPNMDLLTCTSTATTTINNNNNSSPKGTGRRDVATTTMTTINNNIDIADNWTCTGKLNAQAGLGPLDELFHVYHQPNIVDVAYGHNNMIEQQQHPMYSDYAVPYVQYDNQMEHYQVEQHHKDSLQPSLYNNHNIANDYSLQPTEWSAGHNVTTSTCDYSLDTDWNCCAPAPPSYHYSAVSNNNNNTNIYYKNMEQPGGSSNSMEYYDESQVNSVGDGNMMMSMDANYYYGNYDNNNHLQHHHQHNHLQDVRCTDVYY